MAQDSDPIALAIIGTCEDLGFVQSNVIGGVLVEIPSWAEYKKSLPPTGAKDQVKRFHKLMELIKPKTGTSKRHAGRWIIWHTGTMRRDGFTSDSATLKTEMEKPMNKRRITARKPWLI